MINLNEAVSLLRTKREELLDQLDAVDKALAALSRLGVSVISTSEGRPEEAGTASSTVIPRTLKARRTLTDEHKHALNEGRRRARHSKEAAAGLARELPEPSAGQTPAFSAAGQPRLVKRKKL